LAEDSRYFSLLSLLNFSGTGTNLKVESAKSRKFFVVPLHFFGSACTICRHGERFRYGQYILVSFLIAHGDPRAQLFVKVGSMSAYAPGPVVPVPLLTFIIIFTRAKPIVFQKLKQDVQ